VNEHEIYRELLEEGVDDWLPVDRLIGLAGNFPPSPAKASATSPRGF